MSQVVVDLELDSLQYDDASMPLLRDVRAQVHRGESLGIYGPSGSGKSTLCSVLAGIIPYEVPAQMKGKLRAPFMGESFILTRENRSVYYDRVSILMQNPELSMVSTNVLDELVFSLEMRGLAREAIQYRLDEILGLFPIRHLLERTPEELSGGEKQVVGLAAAIATRPGVLILDEPTAMLDEEWTRAFIASVRTSLGTGQLTLIFTSHKAEIIEGLASSLLEIQKQGEHYSASESCLARTAKNGRRSLAPAPPPGDEVIRCESVNFAYGNRTVLHQLNLSIRNGEFILLTGRNGSGKSTLALLMAGLLSGYGGHIMYRGRDIRELPDLCPRRVGLVFQNPDHQIFASTVAEELDLGPRLLGWSKQDRERAKRSVLDRFPFLRDVMGADPRQLSWGQKKVLNILTFAILLSRSEPGVLILDEPDLALDSAYEQVMADMLQALARQGFAVIAISHNWNLFGKYATRIIRLDGGRVLFSGDYGAYARWVSDAAGQT